tara:strand:+ start:39488 stop:40711 length:1224 start_codon:yes stop_codon:yes gene_type:complete
MITAKEYVEIKKRCKVERYYAVFMHRGALIRINMSRGVRKVGERKFTIPARYDWEETLSYEFKDLTFLGVREVEGVSLQKSSAGRAGADPELFIENKDCEVIRASRFVKDKGAEVANDGFQIEIHPAAQGCRQFLASHVAILLSKAQELAKSRSCSLTFDIGRTMCDREWEQAEEEDKQFGCEATESIHEPNRTRISGLKERFRSCGGHIHLGIGVTFAQKNVKTLVSLMDLLCGNTFVILDRDEVNIKRREHYGRAGEHRIKPYGIEYRVLSNFWLRKYSLFSAAVAFCRQAFWFTEDQPELAKELLDRVDMQNIRDAINNNDVELAKENLKVVADFFREKKIYSRVGFTYEYMDATEQWLMSEDPVKDLNIPDSVDGIINEWTDRTEGFERFIIRMSKQYYQEDN